MKKYESVPDSSKELRIEVKYDIGGMNYFTGRPQERGYYLHVSPVNRSHSNGITVESYEGFSGVKKLILPVKRQSNTQYTQAVKLSENSLQELKDHVLNTMKK